MTQPQRLSWKDVRDEIQTAILSGRYGPGDRLPRDACQADTAQGSASPATPTSRTI